MSAKNEFNVDQLSSAGLDACLVYFRGKRDKLESMAYEFDLSAGSVFMEQAWRKQQAEQKQIPIEQLKQQ